MRKAGFFEKIAPPGPWFSHCGLSSQLALFSRLSLAAAEPPPRLLVVVDIVDFAFMKGKNIMISLFLILLLCRVKKNLAGCHKTSLYFFFLFCRVKNLTGYHKINF